MTQEEFEAIAHDFNFVYQPQTKHYLEHPHYGGYYRLKHFSGEKYELSYWKNKNERAWRKIFKNAGSLSKELTLT